MVPWGRDVSREDLLGWLEESRTEYLVHELHPRLRGWSMDTHKTARYQVKHRELKGIKSLIIKNEMKKREKVEESNS